MFTITTTTKTSIAFCVEYTYDNGDFRDPPVSGKCYFITENDALEFIQDCKKKKGYSKFELTYREWRDPNKLPTKDAQEVRDKMLPGYPYA